MLLSLVLLASAAHAAQPAPSFRLEHAFDTLTHGFGQGFSGDGAVFAIQGQSEVSLWDTATGIQKGALPWTSGECGKETICTMAFVALSHDGRAALLENVRTIEKNREPLTASGPIDYKRWTCMRESALELWDTTTEKRVRVLHKSKSPCRPTNSRFQPFQQFPAVGRFSPDGKRAVVAIPTGEKDWRYEGYKNYVFATDGGAPKPRLLPGWGGFTPDGRLRALLLRESSAELRDVDSDARVSLLQNVRGQTYAIYLAPDASAVAIHFNDGGWARGHAWDAETGRTLFDESLPTRSVSLSFASGRRLLKIVQLDGEPTFMTSFDLGSGTWASSQTVPVSGGYGTVVSPDGRYLAASRSDKNALAVFRIHWDAPAPVKVSAAPSAPRLDVDSAPVAKTLLDPDAYAVVIGIEKYRQEGLPGVDFAARDAQTMRRYLVESMGFDPANVVLLQNEKATKTDLEKHLGPWLANRVNEKSRVFIYYAGHGAPNPATGKGFLVPYEGDPNYTDVTGFPIQSLYDALARLPAKDVTVVLDSCFSGSGGRSVLAKGARPLVAMKKQTAGANTTVISAATGGQISASYAEGRHGLLTYFLLEGLHGAADADKDGAVTTSELFAYARLRVEREARKQNLEQTPELTGAGAGVWLRR